MALSKIHSACLPVCWLSAGYESIHFCEFPLADEGDDDNMKLNKVITAPIKIAINRLEVIALITVLPNFCHFNRFLKWILWLIEMRALSLGIAAIIYSYSCHVYMNSKLNYIESNGTAAPWHHHLELAARWSTSMAIRTCDKCVLLCVW